ncbi:MAG: hypothetical protein RIS76_1865 [Verrucomicrobiota bacterium]
MNDPEPSAPGTAGTRRKRRWPTILLVAGVLIGLRLLVGWSNRGADPYSKVELRVQGYQTERGNGARVVEIMLTNGAELSILYPEFTAQAFTRVACLRSEWTNGGWQAERWWKEGQTVQDAVLRPHESVLFPIHLPIKDPPSRVGVFVIIRDGILTTWLKKGANRVLGLLRVDRFQSRLLQALPTNPIWCPEELTPSGEKGGRPDGSM